MDVEQTTQKQKREREEKRKKLAKNIQQISLLLAESSSIATEAGAIDVLVSLSDATSRLLEALNFAQGHGC